MLDVFLRRAIVIVLISALPSVVSVASAGGHSGGSNGGGHSSSSSGTSSASGTGSGHSAAVSGHSAAVSKGGHSTADPVSVSQSSVSNNFGHRVFFHGSTGYNSQNTGAANEDWRRRHAHLLFGFIPVY
jgi:hypothetical protein